MLLLSSCFSHLSPALEQTPPAFFQLLYSFDGLQGGTGIRSLEQAQEKEQFLLQADHALPFQRRLTDTSIE